MKSFVVVLVALLALAACGDDGPKLSIEELQDPATCMECHATHYQEWSGSMHAYASEDPVFVAMNARGQRDTSGALGDFCVNCHAPMAVRLGLTDGTNFDPAALPAAAKGVTCYFCHSTAEVTDTHDNPLVLADDQTMRGGISNPVGNSAHHSKDDALLDSDDPLNQSRACGSCHDIVVPEHINGVPGGVAVERTFAEWKGTIFATDPSPGVSLTCGACHMKSTTDVIADGPGLDVPIRPNGRHSHLFPAIDLALTPFPEMAAQREAVQKDLDPSIGVIGTAPAGQTRPRGGICLLPSGEITVRVDNLSSGHMWPSGAAQDRRTWLEVIAYDVNNTVVFSTGVVPDGMDPEDIDDDNLVGFWDRTTRTDGMPSHFFWDIAAIDSQLLKPAVTLDRNDPAFDHSVTSTFNVIGLPIERIETRVLVRPFPLAALRDLVDSGDLDPAILTAIPTLEVGGTKKTWRRDTAILACNPYP
jgi:nitrate/TMAO reductase-like tetraheme cytochrome c subunit